MIELQNLTLAQAREKRKELQKHLRAIQSFIEQLELKERSSKLHNVYIGEGGMITKPGRVVEIIEVVNIIGDAVICNYWFYSKTDKQEVRRVDTNVPIRHELFNNMIQYCEPVTELEQDLNDYFKLKIQQHEESSIN